MKHKWLIRLTPEQFKRLHDALLSVFRFHIRLEIATVEYEREKETLSVYIPAHVGDGIKDQISYYINGFAKGIEA